MQADHLLDYPFDLYQRSRDIAETVQIIARETGKDRLRILDVGGYRIEADDRDSFLLEEFLPGHEIFAMDLEEGHTPGYVRGDATRMPFKDDSFDVVVTSDVYEHIPPHLRRDFVENLLRVSRGYVLLGAPFFTQKAEMAEELLFEYVYKVLHAEQVQLKEHIDNGLPRMEELADMITGLGARFIRIDSGNLDNWLTMMMVKHYLMATPDAERLHKKLDRFYNINYYESDHVGESYRRLFVTAKPGAGGDVSQAQSKAQSKAQEVLDKIEAHFKTYAGADVAGAAALKNADLSNFRMLLSLEELRTRRNLEEKDRIIGQQAARIHELDTMRTMRLYKWISLFTTRLFKPFSRITGSLVYNLKLFFQIIGGKRRHPYLSFSDSAYRKWCLKNEPGEQELAALKTESAAFASRPLISIVVPVYNTEGQWIETAVRSVLAQAYDNWELCLVNDGSEAAHVRGTLDACAAMDGRVRVKHLRRNRGIAGASNAGLQMARGEFIAFMDSDDALHPAALYEVVKQINEFDDLDVVFSDEDKLTLDGLRRKPVFKNGWDPDLFLTFNYINHLTVVRASLLAKVGGFRREYDWSQDYDLYLRVTEQARRIVHIPKVLYHWRMIPGSSASRVDVRTQALAVSRHLLTETLKRRGIAGVVTDGLRPGTFKIKTF